MRRKRTFHNLHEFFWDTESRIFKTIRKSEDFGDFQSDKNGYRAQTLPYNLDQPFGSAYKVIELGILKILYYHSLSKKRNT
jgi:hypothetical protein